MTEILSDSHIEELITEVKSLDVNIRSKLSFKNKKAHQEASFTVRGKQENDFCVIVRKSQIKPLNFSVILGYQPEKTNMLRLLRRYNGKSHQHRNKLPEDASLEPFYDFHIHYATERYQQEGLKIEGYAEPTDKYFDLDTAIDCLVEQCNFEVPPASQINLLRNT